MFVCGATSRTIPSQQIDTLSPLECEGGDDIVWQAKDTLDNLQHETAAYARANLALKFQSSPIKKKKQEDGVPPGPAMRALLALENFNDMLYNESTAVIKISKDISGAFQSVGGFLYEDSGTVVTKEVPQKKKKKSKKEKKNRKCKRGRSKVRRPENIESPHAMVVDGTDRSSSEDEKSAGILKKDDQNRKSKHDAPPKEENTFVYSGTSSTRRRKSKKKHLRDHLQGSQEVQVDGIRDVTMTKDCPAPPRLGWQSNPCYDKPQLSSAVHMLPNPQADLIPKSRGCDSPRRRRSKSPNRLSSSRNGKKETTMSVFPRRRTPIQRLADKQELNNIQGVAPKLNELMGKIDKIRERRSKHLERKNKSKNTSKNDTYDGNNISGPSELTFSQSRRNPRGDENENPSKDYKNNEDSVGLQSEREFWQSHRSPGGDLIENVSKYNRTNGNNIGGQSELEFSQSRRSTQRDLDAALEFGLQEAVSPRHKQRRDPPPIKNGQEEGIIITKSGSLKHKDSVHRRPAEYRCFSLTASPEELECGKMEGKTHPQCRQPETVIGISAEIPNPAAQKNKEGMPDEMASPIDTIHRRRLELGSIISRPRPEVLPTVFRMKTNQQTQQTKKYSLDNLTQDVRMGSMAAPIPELRHSVHYKRSDEPVANVRGGVDTIPWETIHRREKKTSDPPTAVQRRSLSISSVYVHRSTQQTRHGITSSKPRTSLSYRNLPVEAHLSRGKGKGVQSRNSPLSRDPLIKTPSSQSAVFKSFFSGVDENREEAQEDSRKRNEEARSPPDMIVVG